MGFDPVFTLWVIALILVLLTSYLIWKEWNLPHRFQKTRCLAVLIMMVSVGGILLQPKYQSAVLSAIILLTPNYSETTVDSLLQANPELGIMHIENSKPYKNSMLLPYNDLIERGKEIRFVVGQGLPTYMLDLPSSNYFDFIPSPLPKGITKLQLPTTATINRKNFITGVMNTMTDSSVVYLNGPGGKEDSVRLLNRGLNEFTFSFVPKQAGNVSYEVIHKDGITVKREVIPLYVEEARSLNILFIHHYPSFEIQYLKNFLGKENHQIVLRYQLSKNNFRYEYLNHDPLQINRLTSALLANFNLLITDEEALNALSSIEREILKKSIRSGLGLLNLTGSFKDKRLDTFTPFRKVSVKTDTTVIKIGSKLITTPASETRVVFDPSVTPVQKNKSGILSGYSFDGAGKIAFQFLQETYRLTLSGDSSAYSEVWSSLIEQVAKPRPQKSKIKIATPFPWYENEPIDILIISSDGNSRMRDDSVEIPLQEDVIIDDIWHGRTWGASNGWHMLQTEDGTSMPYYISQKDNLKSLSIANQIERNKILQNASSKTSQKERIVWKEVPPVFFYALFLILAGFLWLAPKL
jgi:hypothetical protein